LTDSGIKRILILGIGNILMGDEGVGVHVVRYLQNLALPQEHVTIIDGGTGSFLLLEPMQTADKVILVDATADGQPIGSVRLLRPKYSRDYPPTLTAHDIGLKDLIDAFYLLGDEPEVFLYAISINMPDQIEIDLSPELKAQIPVIAEQIGNEVDKL
jgi:hydrogenase maturation protease